MLSSLWRHTSIKIGSDIELTSKSWAPTSVSAGNPFFLITVPPDVKKVTNLLVPSPYSSSVNFPSQIVEPSDENTGSPGKFKKSMLKSAAIL